MSTPITIDGARLAYEQRGFGETRTGQVGTEPVGIPLIFQHGMGGDAAQPLGYVGGRPAVSVVCLDARGHGDSAAIGDPEQASFDVFADDVIALADELRLRRFVVGGISLGAGTALNLAVRHPDRVAGLILCRPAWLDAPQDPFRREAYGYLAGLLETVHDGELRVDEAVADFTGTDIYREVLAQSPSAAASLVGQLTRRGAVANSVVLRRFPADSPTSDRAAWAAITVPTLVITHHDDPFHPFDIAEAHAAAIPNARLAVVPSKDADGAGFLRGIEAALHDFLRDLPVDPRRS
jgi:pimeloyl-ACP methyl ester carboxylesterase